ncbi:Asp23/Gls24 family envelope stress response protein [Bianquea renquensis]|uniref:Asp23/Gls24 family envelope stress response protein n=1 Tax=Bianquea renquensis TaxID=2763661 RepID=A0A926DRA1_9FIRM|nr:Asp23/Gls24 family envelope stress response protein [Bianquea renquensis]MBC8543760.1 Asp23/Gls24 family envelope stress response protein [Bianquea renquensis]
MAAKIKTDFGSVTIDSEVIARVAGLAAMECYGVVGMASINVKDGFVQLLLGDSLTKGIKVTTQEDNQVVLEFHIIVEYGTKISAIADNLMSTVKYKVEDMLGLEVANVDIYVEGVRVDSGER